MKYVLFMSIRRIVQSLEEEGGKTVGNAPNTKE